MERKSGKIQCKYQKNDPTFFGTSNFETWLSRDPITWHPEVRCFGYRMTHFIILPPQKFFSSTLQILGFIAESYHCIWRVLLSLLSYIITSRSKSLFDNRDIGWQSWLVTISVQGGHISHISGRRWFKWTFITTINNFWSLQKD